MAIQNLGDKKSIWEKKNRLREVINKTDEETTRENNQFSFFRRNEYKELMMIYSITH